MKQLFALFIFLFAATAAKSQAPDNDFNAFAKKEKNLMLKAYSKKDIAGYRKILDDFLARYNKLGEKEKEQYTWELNEEYYILACAYSSVGDKKNALDYLYKSKDDDYDELLNDHDLDNLRKEPGFVKFINAAKNKASQFQATLQSAPAYNTGENEKLPEFTYQSADDPNLAALKAAFNLDSIAGKGNDISRIINLMEWVHYLIPHDGSKGNPQIKNAMSLINECKKDKKTLNCRGLAILLNEVYLSEGFKSRFVTCLPKDTTDGDCHVINMVWAASLKKWVWMDPTFMGYVMNENGELLSIEEVRERLVNNKPLILNPDANRNHATSQTKSDYLGYYMSKNLYKLECPVSSQYNYETPEEGKTRSYMQLLPGKTNPASMIKKNKHGVASYSLYYTNNPKVFWAAPPADIPAPGTVKTNADYEHVVEQFKNFYNNHNADSIRNMFSDIWGEHRASMWPQKQLESTFEGYGKMISYKYVGRNDGEQDVALFKVVFDKSVHAMGISIDKDNKMKTFRLETRSPYIDKLLAKEL